MPVSSKVGPEVLILMMNIGCRSRLKVRCATGCRSSVELPAIYELCPANSIRNRRSRIDWRQPKNTGPARCRRSCRRGKLHSQRFPASLLVAKGISHVCISNICRTKRYITVPNLISHTGSVVFQKLSPCRTSKSIHFLHVIIFRSALLECRVEAAHAGSVGGRVPGSRGPRVWPWLCINRRWRGAM